MQAMKPVGGLKQSEDRETDRDTVLDFTLSSSSSSDIFLSSARFSCLQEHNAVLVNR